MANIKFFDANVLNEDATYTLTSADSDLANYLYDRDRTTKLTSVGSDDVTDEVYLITFASAKTVDAIIVDNHNIKAGDIKYWNGAAYVDFSTAISYSGNTNSTDYHTFDSVSTERIQITMNTTQVVDAQKFIGQFYAFEELGTLTANPSSWSQSFPEASLNHTGADKGSIYVLFGKKYKCKMSFDNAVDADVTLIETLKNNGQSFFIWPCGSTTTFTDIGFRVQDIFFVNFTSPFNPQPRNDLLGVGTTLDVSMEEV